MDGLINFYKPTGVTSAKALYRVRKITGQRKSGHAGSLDPAAEGVLLLCMGKGTKLVERLMDQPKRYRATARLDVTSESFDSDRPLTPVPVETPPTLEQLQSAAARFEGVIQQVPPAISAVKIAGRPAYKLNRGGAVPKLDPRPVTVYWLEIIDYAWPNLTFETASGRGFYVRSLIRDLGAAVGAGGCLTSLLRISVGPFHMDDACTFEKLEQSPPEEALIPLERAVDLLAQPTPVPPRP